MIFLDSDDFGVRKLNHNFVWTDIDRYILPEIEACFRDKSSAQLDPLLPAGPGVGELAFRCQLLGQGGELSRRRRGFVDYGFVIDCDSRLQIGDVDKS